MTWASDPAVDSATECRHWRGYGQKGIGGVLEAKGGWHED